MSKHTPGPWIERNGLVEAKTRNIAKVHYEYVHYGLPARTEIEAEDDANARLIAAAPKLLEAAKEAVTSLEAHGYHTSIYGLAALKVAIREAEGGQ